MNAHAALLCAFLFALPAALVAQPVYRCETGGKVAYSDAPCVGAQVIDATPTQGMDKMAGPSRKSAALRHQEFQKSLDSALRPLTGRSHEEMNVQRKRVGLSAADQRQCSSLDAAIPQLSNAASRTTDAAKAQADVAVYKARKRFFDLKC